MVLSFGPARVSPENIDLSSSSPSSSSSKRRPRVSMSPPSPAGGASSSNRARRPPPPSPDDSDEDRITVHSPGGSSLDADSDDKTCFTDEHLLLMDPTPPSSPENEMTSNEGARKHEATTSSKGAASVVAPCTARPVSSLSLSSRVAAKMDSCLQRYTQYMATSLHQDRGLKLLQWTLWLASRLALLKTNHKQPQQQHGGGDMKSLQYLSQCLRKLYLDCSFARYATRAFGLPTAIAAARTGSWGYQSSTTLTKHRRLHDVLGKLMALSMVGYYPTELVAYLQWMLPARPVKQGMPYSRSAERWSYWSCRFWLAYLIAETCQCLLVYKELRDQEQESQRQDGDGDDKNCKADRQSLMRYTKIQLLRDALFFLPCLNWSLPNWDIDPLLSENVVNGLSWLESIVCLYQ